MSRIAQKLCDEIVEPVIMSTGESNTKSRSRHHSQFINKPPSQSTSKPVHSIIIEKKVTSKIFPNDQKASKTKANEPLIKNYHSKAANTEISGPLRCNTDCLTVVQKRGNKCSCKCLQKRTSNKTIPKMIQTLDNAKYILQTDKACIHTVEAISCGTQYSDKLSEIPINLWKNPSSKRSHSGSSHQRSITQPAFNDFMGARRWALTQHRTQGPDF